MKNQLINQGKALLLSVALVGTSLTALNVVAAEANTAQAQQEQKSKDHKKRAKHEKKQFKKMVRALDLTEEQQVKIKAIKADARAQNKALKDTMKTFKSEVAPLVEADVLDEQAVLSVYESHSDAFAQKLLARIKTEHAINQVLTEEQRVKWQEIKAKMKKKGKSRR